MKCLEPQRMQIFFALLPWKRPGVHGLQIAVASFGAMAPARQSEQLDTATAPSTGFAVPGLHAVHADDASLGLNRPAAQPLQCA